VEVSEVFSEVLPVSEVSEVSVVLVVLMVFLEAPRVWAAFREDSAASAALDLLD